MMSFGLSARRTGSLRSSRLLVKVGLIASLAAVSRAVSYHATERFMSQKSNPMHDMPFSRDPRFRANIESSMQSASQEELPALDRIKDVSTALWLSTKSAVERGVYDSRRAESVLREASTKEPKPLVTMIVYNLPNRDCSAEASAGEICCSRMADGRCNKADTSNMCEEGLSDYKHNYIDKLAHSVREFCESVPMAFVIEPDSLPNFVTNSKNPGCGNRATQAAYRHGIKHAVHAISTACPSALIYLDAAHGGWLGWEGSSELYMLEVASMDIAHLLRGFALNVSNYRELGVQCPTVGFCNGGANADHECCQTDPCSLGPQFNQGFTEINYAASLRAIAESTMPSFTPRFVIDTSRNGARDASISCESWCNPRGAGVGMLPSTQTINDTLLDAYMWLKTPGESDGCTEMLPDGHRCPRFDERCASKMSLGGLPTDPRAPEAGAWFDSQIKMLAMNARH